VRAVASLSFGVYFQPQVKNLQSKRQIRAVSNTFSNAEVVTIATRQKRIIWVFLASLTIVPIIAMFAPVVLLLSGLVQFAVCYDLAKSLKFGEPPALFIVMLIPFVNLILMLTLVAKASKVIREKGVSVGLLGASKSQLEQLAATA